MSSTVSNVIAPHPRPWSIRGLRRLAPVVAVVLGVGLTACAPPSNPGASETSPESSPSAPATTAGDVVAWASGAEWSFAPDGLQTPFPVAFTDGAAVDDSGRTYELGDGVEADADGDGVIDVAIPVTQHDGNGVLRLWYVWLGVDRPGEGEPAAEQVVYPIARMSRCGDVVNDVAAVDGGYRIDQVLRLPFDTTDCASGGTGQQVREVHVERIDGVAYPIQTAPIPAWGGVCPRSEWMDGLIDEEVDARAAPPASAPQVIAPGEAVSLYELPDAPLLTADGTRFFGFQTEEIMAHGSTTSDKLTHCAFAG
ncbi:hypothetical protein GCM10025768_13590 [Microbacterium pseudoresistens]|uniref:Uncharacterized protein n=1 Tax=Microbacterium pseudoresistens TaxID=640634 RepID=A0A7Y9JLU1_9MICO|nr:hypothetical protein [Microbacterium pseudoresistens]NYD53286.1 hypothetical protein [Microbacterium pseudoresistens]